MNQAREKKSNRILEAEELRLMDEVIQSNYECVDENCKVHLIPCSHKEINKRRPFFKLPKGVKHKKNCRFSEYLRLLEEARRRRLEERELKQFPYPAILKKQLKLPERKVISDVSLPGLSVSEKEGANSTYDWDNSGVSNRSVTSISQIVDFYVECPLNRDLELNVFGEVMSYRYWFKRIKEKNKGQYKKRRFFFGRLFMKDDRIQENENEIVISLYDCEGWKDPIQIGRTQFNRSKEQTNPYTVHVSKIGLSQHKTSRILNELNFAKEEQKEDYRNGGNSTNRAYVFFLADPPKRTSPYRFDVIEGFLVSRYVTLERHLDL